MAYITAQDVVNRIGEPTALRLTTDTGSTVDTTVITAIINEVEPHVETAIRTRIGTTITQANYPADFKLIAGKVMDMVIFKLAASRRPPAPAEWKQLNDQAVAWLQEFVEGKRNLPTADLNDPQMEWGGEDQNAAAQRG